MLKYIESTGRSEEAAIEAALQKLGMDRDDVSVEVLEQLRASCSFNVGAGHLAGWLCAALVRCRG